MRLSFTEMAIAQKMDFFEFAYEWKEKHDIIAYQWNKLLPWMEAIGWGFFIDELVVYYQSRRDLYRVYDDTVELIN